MFKTDSQLPQLPNFRYLLQRECFLLEPVSVAVCEVQGVPNTPHSARTVVSVFDRGERERGGGGRERNENI